MRSWKQRAITIFRREPIQFLYIFILVAVIHSMAFIIPVTPWLPNADDANSFLKTLWQIHASIVGIVIIVITIIITVIANEKDRTRTWQLYIGKTKFKHIVWFNLIAILSEGLALLQTYSVTSPIFLSDRAGNLIISEGILLIVSILLTGILVTITVKFLDDDYIEDLAEKRIIKLMHDAVTKDMERIAGLSSAYKESSSGH